jgi:ABC-type Fe3+/spermidine/putrescine transport system ATPase subunit
VLYNQPADVFVARFLGPVNLLQGQVDSNGSEARREVVVRTPLGRLVARASGAHLPQGAPVTISIRPETLSLGPTIPTDWNRFPATIERIIFRGEIRQIDLRGPGDWPITARLLQSHLQGLREGQSLTLSVSPENVALLPGKFAVGSST